MCIRDRMMQMPASFALSAAPAITSARYGRIFSSSGKAAMARAKSGSPPIAYTSQGVGGRDRPVQVRIVDDRGEEIEGADEGLFPRKAKHPGVVGVRGAHEHTR